MRVLLLFLFIPLLLVSTAWSQPLFWPAETAPPEELQTDHLRLVPLQPAHGASDYAAFMGSQSYLLATQGWGWPTPDVTPEQNEAELALHARFHAERRAFTYSVQTHKGRVVGCLYLNAIDETWGPHVTEAPAAQVVFWMTKAAQSEGLDAELVAAVTPWLANAWPFERILWPVYALNARQRAILQLADYAPLATADGFTAFVHAP